MKFSNQSSRRTFLRTGLAATSMLLPAAGLTTDAHGRQRLPVSCNGYNWITFYERAGKSWMADPEASLSDFAATGFKAYEPGVHTVEEIAQLKPGLDKYNIALPSVYIGSTLHEADTSAQNIELFMKIALAAKAIGTRIIVTNPSPIRWGSPEDKDDAALILQARNLEKLGELLKAQGMTLAYHNHDIELRQGAREFHHMLASTDPRLVSLCLDVHWVYRGTGNSQVALFDVVKTYGKRIVELHIRQSVDHVWSEVFGKGDIDYSRLVAELVRIKVRPHLVLEQCLETGSPNTTDVVSAHRQGLSQVMSVFAPVM